MQYLGGKTRIAKQLTNFLELNRKDGQTYVEPFVGGGSVVSLMSGLRGRRIAGDGNKSLIALYNAVQNGWIPPDHVSEVCYKDYLKRFREDKGASDDPMQAFVLIGCGFGGKWGAGYARSKSKDRNYAKTSKNSLLKMKEKTQDVVFVHKMFNEWEGLRDCLIYCDPPYNGTTSYGAFKEFDHDAFWNVVREWSKNNTVFVSEYKAPEDFVCVAEFKSRMGLRNKDGEHEIRSEKVFAHMSIADNIIKTSF